MKTTFPIRRGAAAALVVVLSSCTSLPRSGPDAGLVDSQASVKVSSKDRKVGIDYALVDLNQNMLKFFDSKAASSLKASFGNSPKSPPDIPLGYGDVVQVSIFESQSGGLFIPSDAGSRAGNFITIPSQTIDRGGTITVPYAGRIVAAGKRKEEVEAAIVKKLSTRAIEPQVVVTTVTSNSSQVAVLGDVNTPAKVELSPAGERVLDAISQAGGLSTPAMETNITLQRRGKTATVPYETLMKNPSENIFVSPMDTVIADHRARAFVAFGATGTNGRYTFDDENLTLADGLGKAGGALDAQANPAQVMLYRLVDKKLLREMGVNVANFRDDQVPVVFRANLRDPAGFFAAQKFAMADKDVIYISNAGSVELLKFLDIANSVTSTAAGTTSDAVTTRNSIRAF
ncbi:MAG: polysaccharide biosynthesis/export family protein [Rhizobium sp.]